MQTMTITELDKLRDRVRAGAMTQKEWDGLSIAQREHVRDKSQLHPLLTGLEGWRVEVEYASGTPGVGYSQAAHWHLPRFIVGRTTGWCPCHLALRRCNQRSTSNTITAATPIVRVRKIEKVRG